MTVPFRLRNTLRQTLRLWCGDSRGYLELPPKTWVEVTKPIKSNQFNNLVKRGYLIVHELPKAQPAKKGGNS